MPAPSRMHRPMCSGAPSACVFAAVAMLVACVAHVPEEGQSDLRCRDDSECTAPQRCIRWTALDTRYSACRIPCARGEGPSAGPTCPVGLSCFIASDGPPPSCEPWRLERVDGGVVVTPNDGGPSVPLTTGEDVQVDAVIRALVRNR